MYFAGRLNIIQKQSNSKQKNQKMNNFPPVDENLFQAQSATLGSHEQEPIEEDIGIFFAWYDKEETSQFSEKIIPHQFDQSIQPEIENHCQADTNELSHESQRPKRWEINHLIFYLIFSLEQTSGPNAQKISFLEPRRSYKRFDKDFAELLLKEFEPHVFNDESLAKKMTEDYAKRTKSKFNTLKRSYFKSKKERIEDFPIYIFTESEKIVKQNNSILSDRLKTAMEKWKDYQMEQCSEIASKLFGIQNKNKEKTEACRKQGRNTRSKLSTKR